MGHARVYRATTISVYYDALDHHSEAKPAAIAPGICLMYILVLDGLWTEEVKN